jgi:Zn-dependent M16 (insulinase) family peptidase
MIISADFTDTSRLKELLMQHLHGVENSIQNSSLRYAVNLAANGFSIASKITNTWYGLDYFWWLKETVKEFEQSPKGLIERLQKMQHLVLGLQGADLVLSCDDQTLANLKKEGFYGLNSLPAKPFTKWRGDYKPGEKLSQGRIITSPVAFTALLFSSVPYTHPFTAALSLAAEIMDNKILHKKIREQGGAYGCGAVNGVLSEQFYFYSYRDPHLKTTLKAFHQAIEALVAGKFSTQDIEEAKLGLFQDLDAPTAPGSRAMTAYSRLRGGRTQQVRQNFRDALFTYGKEEIQQVAKELLLPNSEKGVVTCFASKEFLDKENALLHEKALPVYII